MQNVHVSSRVFANHSFFLFFSKTSLLVANRLQLVPSVTKKLWWQTKTHVAKGEFAKACLCVER